MGLYNPTHKQLKRTQTGGVLEKSTKIQSNNHSAAYTAYPVFSPIAFSGQDINLLKVSRLRFLDIPNIPCPCCGKIMVTRDAFNAKLNEKTLSGTCIQALKMLSQFEENIHGVEKICFQQIKKIAKQSPKSNLQELLMNLRPESLKKLRASQFKILAKIDDYGKDLSPESALKLTRITNRNRSIITVDDPNNPFKRKSFINELLQFKEQIPEKEIGEKIYQHSFKLNNSENDSNAFIVKYSQRSPREIGQRMVSKSISTLEHIKPKAKGGQNLAANYLPECAGDNNKRQDTDLDIWITTEHPEMIKNTQRHMDIIINKINSGQIRDYEWWPAAVAKTLEVESKGLIKLDLSKLKQPSIKKVLN